MSKKLQLYNFFHLNLAYSAIEEAQRPTVVQKCYWPLLRLASRYELPFGIELSGYTLETIAAIDPGWVAELKGLLGAGKCELIGCGYAQMIGPLVPAEVNLANLTLGMESYERFLGVCPELALVNEQAYSSGLVPLYGEAGYSALIMEWNNPAHGNPDWNPEWRYLPQRACGPGSESMPLVWNHSIAFQKFQRYVHGELDLREYLDYIRSHISGATRAFPVYGNDVEVFDFRPGRYENEEPLHADGEWQRIESLYRALIADPEMEIVSTSSVLSLMDEPEAGHKLLLETAAQPVPVKKQGKYNLLRWAVTGRNDFEINTTCYAIYQAIREDSKTSADDWRELAYLWSSDFRTHITEARWSDYRARLTSFARRWNVEPKSAAEAVSQEVSSSSGPKERALEVVRQGRFLIVDGQNLQVRLNCHRGLALDSFVDHRAGETAICGTLHHGYFDNIQWGADYYSGHLVYHSPGRAKVTDLNQVEPRIQKVGSEWCISATIPSSLGPVEKSWWIDDDNVAVRLSYHLDWPDAEVGSLRLGHITLVPDAFELGTLEYRAHNGGRSIETYSLADKEFDHGRGVSFLISAGQAIGITENVIEVGSTDRFLRIELNQSESALVAMMTHLRVGRQFFTRLAFSAREVDDTSRKAPVGPIAIQMKISSVLKGE